jgi:hypothetical protein
LGCSVSDSGSWEGKVRSGEERGREGAYLVMLVAGEDLRTAPPRRAVAARREEGHEGEEGYGRFCLFFVCFFLKKKIFFVESVNEEKKSKIKPNWNGPKFMGRLKLSAKYNSPTSQPTISSKKKKN